MVLTKDKVEAAWKAALRVESAADQLVNWWDLSLDTEKDNR